MKIFVMGENAWREEEEWPLARARPTRFYLHSDGRANSVRGDGALSTVLPEREPADEFVYDPADPVRTQGGGNCCDHDHLAPGLYDQRPAENREDVLVYSTAVLDGDVEVTGPVLAELYVSSSAVDSDFTAKLVDVHPDGFAGNVADGILRMRFRNSVERPERLDPGEVYRISVDLWATSNLFCKGHRIRLEIASSNFPRYDRNLNTGEDLLTGRRIQPARQAVYMTRSIRPRRYCRLCRGERRLLDEAEQVPIAFLQFAQMNRNASGLDDPPGLHGQDRPDATRGDLGPKMSVLHWEPAFFQLEYEYIGGGARLQCSDLLGAADRQRGSPGRFQHDIVERHVQMQELGHDRGQVACPTSDGEAVEIGANCVGVEDQLLARRATSQLKAGAVTHIELNAPRARLGHLRHQSSVVAEDPVAPALETNG